MFFADALRCVGWGGRALVIGFAGGEIEKVRGVTSRGKAQLAQLRRQLPLNLVLLKNVSVIGTYWGSYQSATRHLSFFIRQV
jgi:NADPH2:quinone reductase